MTWWSSQSIEFPWRSLDEAEWRRLVTEVLLQRTHVAAVKNIYLDFFERFPTPESLAAATVEEVEEAIYSLGLHWRAQLLPQLASSLVEGVPEAIDELLAKPGVGPYVAGAYMVLHKNSKGYFVDANVVRLLGRFLGFSWDGETRRKRWFLELAQALFQHNYPPRDFGYALLDFSREICGRAPLCFKCGARSFCTFARGKMESPADFQALEEPIESEPSR